MRRLRGGDPGGLWVTAGAQTGGRGRQGRVWSSPPGNLYASLALRLAIAPVVAPQLGFVAGVALAAVLRDLLGGDARLRIKWPNDIIFAGAKLAGLLLESTPLRDGGLGCVIGFGLNCRSHPTNLAYPATSLAAIGGVPDPEPMRLLALLSESVARQLAIWNDGAQFNKVREAWMSVAFEVVLAERRITGTFQGLDPAGRLLLETDREITVVDAGDVFLPGISADLA
jgi:BirA family biotin operon repressor/biotin-[acetyl-CoA-carboxylase] ligase